MMLLGLIFMCIVGVGTHRTFGVRRQAWIEWMHSNTDPRLHTMHAVFGRPVFSWIVCYWLMVVMKGWSVLGVSTFLSWGGKFFMLFTFQCTTANNYGCE